MDGIDPPLNQIEKGFIDEAVATSFSKGEYPEYDIVAMEVELRKLNRRVGAPDEPERVRRTASGTPRARKAATDEYHPFCLCGCGAENRPGSRFKPGHDARVKGIISRILSGKTRPGDAIPEALFEAASKHHNTFAVAGYDALMILAMAEDDEDDED